MLKFVRCTFVNRFHESYGSLYSFKTLLDVKVGDKLVVDSEPGLAVVEVKEVSTSDDFLRAKRATKWAFMKVDTVLLDALKVRESRISEITAALEEKVSKRERLSVYESLAKEDPEAKAMIDELTNLGEMAKAKRSHSKK